MNADVFQSINPNATTFKELDRLGGRVKKQVFEVITDHHRRYGDGLPTHTRSTTAIHEVGHVLCKYIRGKKVLAVISKDKSSGVWTGYTDSPNSNRENFMANYAGGLGYGIFSYAGFASELIVGGSRSFASSIDERIYAHICWQTYARLLGRSVPETVVQGILGSLTLVRKYKQQLKVLALRLEGSKKLRTKEVGRILADVPQLHGGSEVLWQAAMKAHSEAGDIGYFDFPELLEIPILDL